MNQILHQVGHHIVVIDAGGGTIDVSGYVIRKVHPLSVEEIFAPECSLCCCQSFFIGSLSVHKAECLVLRPLPNEPENISPVNTLIPWSPSFVNRFRISVKLRSSRYGAPDEIKHITECFNKSTNRLFKNINEPIHVQFGSPRDKDLEHDIRGGMLKLSG